MGTADSGIPGSCLDFVFGFDDAKYSDRTLVLQIVDPSQLVRKVKRSRKLLLPEFTGPRVKSIYISSLILAARSSFFRKLFSNGMLESEQKNVTIQIETSEEAPMMDMLKYVYSNTLPTTLDALLDLLVIADKFEVPSCLEDSTRALLNLPMTCESASLYLELPSTLLMSPQLQPLADAAKHFLISKLKDLDKFTEEVLNLPLNAFQALVSSDELEVTSERVVYNFVLKWMHKHYPLDLEERREILETHLLHLIRFPFMTSRQLTEEVQTCIDIGCEVASKIVIRALAFKAESPHRKRCLAAEEGNAASRQFVERAYKYRPINVIELEKLPYHQCIGYLHFKREKLIRLFPEGLIMSDFFYLGEQEFYWFIRCSSYSNIQHRFWLGLHLVGSTSFSVDYDIQLKMKPSEEFSRWVKGSHTFTESSKTKYFDKIVFWSEFIGDDSSYFVNDFLHMRAELTTKK